MQQNVSDNKYAKNKEEEEEWEDKEEEEESTDEEEKEEESTDEDENTLDNNVGINDGDLMECTESNVVIDETQCESIMEKKNEIVS